MRLDLNGVVKARTVDDALALLDGKGFVSAGGDLATHGAIVVALPRDGTVSLMHGALATSGADRRRWVRGGRRQHHLIDPRTGRPADSPWEQVTVCGALVRRRGRRSQDGLRARPRGTDLARRARPPRAVRERRRRHGQPVLAAKRRMSGRVHLTSNPVDWYAARAAGITAYLLLSGVVLLGLTMGAKKTFARWPRFTVEDLHRFGGLLVGILLAIHIVTVAIDSWLPFSLGSLVVPFTTRYRPIWVGLGVVAAELLLALAVTNHYRRSLRYSTWRRAHYLNFAVWARRASTASAAAPTGARPGSSRSFAVAVARQCPPRPSGASAARPRVGARVLPLAGPQASRRPC